VFNSSVIPATGALRSLLDQLAGSYSNAAAQAGNLASQAAAAAGQQRMLDERTWRGAGLIGQTNGAIQGSSDPDLPFDGPTPDRRPTIELGTDDGSRDAKRASGARAKAISEAERERKAVADLIEQLEFERSTLGMTDA